MAHDHHNLLVRVSSSVTSPKKSPATDWLAKKPANPAYPQGKSLGIAQPARLSRVARILSSEWRPARSGEPCFGPSGKVHSMRWNSPFASRIRSAFRLLPVIAFVLALPLMAAHAQQAAPATPAPAAAAPAAAAPAAPPAPPAC